MKPAQKRPSKPPLKKMGRPALPPEERADQVIHVRLTADELARFDAYAAEVAAIGIRPARAAVLKGLALRALDAQAPHPVRRAAG